MLCASKRNLPCVVLALVVALVLCAPVQARPPKTGLPGLAYGRPAPDFTFDLGAGPRRLSSLAGRPIVINFWATWCVPCRDELGIFRSLRATYGDRVSLVTITDEPSSEIRDFLAAHDLDLPVVEDPTRKIFDAFGITPIPTTIVLGPGLGVAFVSIGELSWPELHGAIDGTLYPTSGVAP